MSWRGGGPCRWALAVACRGGGSASLGWASVPWEKAPDLDCELRPAGPDAGARVRGRWVGIQPQDSPSPPASPGSLSRGTRACAEVAARRGCPR